MLLSFPREIGLRRSICPSLDRFSSYVDTVNGKANCYTSLFSFKERDPQRPWKPDYNSVVLGGISIWVSVVELMMLSAT